jgi:LEA14-like dessication related protein
MRHVLRTPFLRLPRPLRALPAALLLATAACGGSGHRVEEPTIPFQRPAVALRDVRLRGAGILGGAAELELRVHNPNDYDLTQPRVRYRVLLDDVEVATGFTDLDVTVPAEDSVVVKLPATFNYARLGRAGRLVANTGSAPYRVLGRIHVGTPYGRLSFPYDRVGQFAPMSARLPR